MRLLGREEDRPPRGRRQGGASAVEKMYGRAWLTSQSISRAEPQTKPPCAPSALRQGADLDQALVVAVGQVVGQAAAVLAENAGRVGLVENKDGIVFAHQGEQSGHVGEVAVHAENAIADDDATPCAPSRRSNSSRWPRSL